MFPAYTKILLAASWSGFKTEIIDFKNPSFTCSKLNQFPKQTAGAVGGMVGDTPFVCGGVTSSHGPEHQRSGKNRSGAPTSAPGQNPERRSDQRSGQQPGAALRPTALRQKSDRK